jgi:uncharacterized membrane protein YheB (UPF0754 family)
VEEYLRGEAFEQEAEAFLNSTIDKLLERPLNEIIGQLEPEKFEMIKAQVADRLLEIAQSQALLNSISDYFSDVLERFGPQSLQELLGHARPDAVPRIKDLLTKSLLGLLARDDTARTVNAILSSQIERLLIAPIGRLGDHLSEHSVKRASTALVERITGAARERLPAAISEFDVGGLVRRKVSDYPTEKLEALVLSVAQHHLKTIELFGAVIGFFIGVGQTVYFWLTYVPSG